MKHVAAILGAGPGNGAAFAQRFLKEGYFVAVCSRNVESMAKLAASLGTPEKIRGYACDVTSDAAVSKTFASIQADFGPVTTVVYNAGSGGFKPVKEWTAAEITQAADINAAGLYRAATTVLPHFEANGGGNLVVIGAGAAWRGRPMTVGFAAGKAAQRSVAQSLARAYGPQKVHVSYIVVDGVVLSENTKAWGKGDDFFLHSDAIADAVWMLVNQDQSAWTFELDIRPFGENW